MWLNGTMITLIVFGLAACGLFSSDQGSPIQGSMEPVIEEPPMLNCPSETTLESGSSAKGVEHWCDRGGVMHGPYLLHHPNEEKATSGTYDNNQEHGAWTWWHDNGQQAQKGKYNRGKKTGAWTWWHENGNRLKEGDYLQGRRQGQWTTFYPSGMKESEGMFQNDRRNGVWNFYSDDEDNAITKTERYENDEMIEEQIIRAQR